MVDLSENEGIEGRTFVVTGGAGLVGRALCLELARRGAAEVRSFDICTAASADLQAHGVVCIQGDIRQKADVEKAFKHANCVFHLASFGMSGKETIRARQIDEVNLDGTCHVLESCIKCGVGRLVYTSTYNVVFGGKEIINGHESMKYFSLDENVDPYGRSKSLAEQLVLKSNNRQTKGRSKLYTCALRPATVYGAGDHSYLHRVYSAMKHGYFLFTVGGLDTKQDWVYIDNLVHAQILASMALLDDLPDRKGIPPAAGQAYFISDGSPINAYKFIRPMVDALGGKLPDFNLSVKAALRLAWSVWGVYGLLYPWLDKAWLPEPILLPPDVYKVGVTHYFTILKARVELGYAPLVEPKEGMARTAAYWKKRKEEEMCFAPFYIYLLFSFLYSLVWALLPPSILGPLKWGQGVVLFFFRSTRILRNVFIFTLACHIGEGTFVWCWAKRVDPANSAAWAWQSFYLGFPSLLLLRKRANLQRVKSAGIRKKAT